MRKLDKLFHDTTGSIAPERVAGYQRATISDLSQSLMVFKWKKLEGKMAEIKSLIKELEIDLNRARKGKPPLNNAEGKPKKNIIPEVLQKYSEIIREGIGMCLKSYKQNLQWRVYQSLGLFKCLETLLTNMATLINQFMGLILQ